MALYESVTGGGILRSKTSESTSWYYITATGQKVRITLTTTTEVREWVALTRSAAEAWVSGSGDGEVRRIRQDNPILDSWVAEKTTVSKSISKGTA